MIREIMYFLALGLTFYRGIEPSSTEIQTKTEYETIRVTCYYDNNLTSSGLVPRYGVVAGTDELQGHLIKLYRLNDEYIGTFLVCDTGGELISSGQRLDVYVESEEGVKEWQQANGDYCKWEILNNAETRSLQSNRRSENSCGSRNTGARLRRGLHKCARRFEREAIKRNSN